MESGLRSVELTASDTFTPLPVFRIAWMAWREYLAHWRSYTLCFLIFAAPVVCVDLILGAVHNGPNALSVPELPMPRAMARAFDFLSRNARWADWLTSYFFASVAATVVLTVLSEATHQRPIRAVRCVGASWKTMPSVMVVAVFQLLAVGVVFLSAVAVTALLDALLDKSPVLVASIIMLFEIAIFAAALLGVVLVCLVVAISTAQIVLQRRSARGSILVAIRLVVRRRVIRRVVKQGIMLFFFSSTSLVVTLFIVFTPIFLAVMLLQPQLFDAAWNVATVLLAAVFWPPVTLAYTFYAIQLLQQT